MKTILTILTTALVFFPTVSSAEGVVQCGNLIYAGTKTSTCFSDEFLTTAQQKTSIAAERRFKAVKLADDELFSYPFVIMTGADDFSLTAKERENLKKYLENGGFLLASASCSNKDWDKAFRREIARVLENQSLSPLPMEHPIFRTVFEIEDLGLSKSDGESTLEGIDIKGKTVVIYSKDGLNDTPNAPGCCCCGGNEITNARQLNVNILAYALLQ